MPRRTVHVKIRYRRQLLDERDLVLDPKDDGAVLAALADTLAAFKVDPTPDHTIAVYVDKALIRKLAAA